LRIDDVADGVDVAGGDSARAGLAQGHALGALALHLDGDRLDVQDNVGDVLAHARDRGELMQHAVDLDGGDGGTLERGEQHATQRIAERHAEAALERTRDHGGQTLRVVADLDFELVRLGQILPILADHDRTPGDSIMAAAGRPVPASAPADAASIRLRLRRGDACAAGSHCAGSASRRGSR
jgi:hypothetical protein